MNIWLPLKLSKQMCHQQLGCWAMCFYVISNVC